MPVFHRKRFLKHQICLEAALILIIKSHNLIVRVNLAVSQNKELYSNRIKHPDLSSIDLTFKVVSINKKKGISKI